MQTIASKPGEHEGVSEDLGPLAWVQEEIQKSLDGATKALKRFVRDAEQARGSDLAELDASQLRSARQQLHQAVGALEMVGLSEPAKVLRAMEALAQKFVQRPELCSDDAAVKVERAAFALTEYLEGVLKGRKASPVALFPQYRDVLDLVGGDRVHPADLWQQPWAWIDATLPIAAAPLAYDPTVRARMDQAVLKLVKTGDAESGQVLRDISLGFAAAQKALEPRVFWKICGAYCEALAHGLFPTDVYVKRATSRILTQYATLARGDQSVSDRLAQDLLFFCAQSVPKQPAQTPVLVAVRAAFGLNETRPADYVTYQYGRFDPTVLAQARKRIAAATETWSAVSGGDANRLKVAVEQFAGVSESMLKLHPLSGDLAHALTHAVDVAARQNAAPSMPVAMEVATAVLYLDATYEDLDPTDTSFAERSVRLAHRLEHVGAGGQPEPLEAWMEELYRRVSDRQTMGNVVQELRTTLGGIEKSLDQFFRNPSDKKPLHEVPSQLAQMRGVFSVLGLDQASIAALRMRDSVEKFLIEDSGHDARPAGVFEKLGNSLGAMGFLIDMLNYQRVLAKKLFVYDEELGEFKPLMGREKLADPADDMARTDAPASPAPAVHVPLPPPVAMALPAAAKPAPAPAPKPVPAPAPKPASAEAAVKTAPPVPVVPKPLVPAPVVEDDEDVELRDIFLEEAREVVQTGLQAVSGLAAQPADLGEQTTLRRAFHTLKGSSRMVGFNEFGEAAWSFEQMLNTWLAEQKPASKDLIELSAEAMRAFGRWVEDIAANADTAWSAQTFRTASDGLRLQHQRVPLVVPGIPVQPVLEPIAELAPDKPLEEVETPLLEDLALAAPETVPEAAGVPVAEPEPELEPEPVAKGGVPPEAVVELELDPPQMDFEGTQFLEEPKALAPAHAAATQDNESLNLDFDFDFDVEPKAELLAIPKPEPEPEPSTPVIDLSDADELIGLNFSSDEEYAPAAALLPMETPDEQVKVIGDLQINIPLYNVYLNEADEWSRRLSTELSEWALELPNPIPDSTVALAHSLSGASATVGFTALSNLARLLEQTLEHVQLHRQGSPEHAATFNDAAEEIRRLLHQFAAGFLREPDTRVPVALAAILAFDFVEDVDLATEKQPVIPLLTLDEDLDVPLLAIPEPEPEREHKPEAQMEPELQLELDEPEPELELGLESVAEPDRLAAPDEALELDFELNVPGDEPITQGMPLEIPASVAESLAPTHDAIDGLEFSLALPDDEKTTQGVPLDFAPPGAAAGHVPELADDDVGADLNFVLAMPDDARSYVILSAEPTGQSPDPEVIADLDLDLIPESRSELEPELRPALDFGPEPVADEVIPEFDFILDRDGKGVALADESGDAPHPESEVEALFVAPATVASAPVVVPPAAPVVKAGEDDDTDNPDVLDADLFPIFEEEAIELMPKLGAALRQWTEEPDNSGARREALRVLHTLKGSARLAGAMRLGELAHRMESAIEYLGLEDLSSSAIEPLLGSFDTLGTRFDKLRAGPNQVLSLPETPKATDDQVLALTNASGAPLAEAATAVLIPQSTPAPAAVAVRGASRQTGNQTVRVRSQLLDRLLNQAGEVMITRSRLDARLEQLRSSLGDLTGNLDRLRQQLRDVEVQAESQMQSRMASVKDTSQAFDPLEFDRFTRVQELTRMMAESVNDVATVQRTLQRTVEGTEDDLIAQARQARELQRDLLRTRMVEFEGISERLYGVVRQACKDVGKQVKLDIVGGSMEMDRGILERIAPAFEHMLRNSVAHGIEDAATRAAAGKPALGTITIEVRQESNSVSVSFRDDGGGLDLARIRAKAIANGLLTSDAELSDAEAAGLVFMPGFSTSKEVTEVSGRGIGLDVVRNEVNALGGRIETTSELGKGAQFTLVLPLTTAVTQVVMLRLGDLAVGVPANVIETIQRVPANELTQAYATDRFAYAGESVPFFWAGALLQASARSQESIGKHAAVAIFRSVGQRIAVHVDEVLGNQEVVVKNLGSQLSRLPGLTGMSVLASGAVALIYIPVALAAVYGDQARQLSATAVHLQAGATEAGAPVPPVGLLGAPAGASLVPLVLVVDDSITVRRVTQRLLKREGYRVALAADGLQALERLKEERPALVLSDIEMPRMDGFDLARNIRADEDLRDLPIIMITSRIAEKHREHARQLGVEHYLGKPYPEEELMGLVRHYCTIAVSG